MRSSKAAFWSVACALVLRASGAPAQAPPPAMPERLPETAAPIQAPPPAAVRWYGWQTLVADAGAVALVGLTAGIAGSDGDSATAAAVGLIGLSAYLFGGPILHAAHGHWGKAGVSLALRLGLPVLGWAVGFGLGSSSCHYAYDHEGCPTDYAAVGTLFGIFAGVALDAALLGHEPAVVPPRPERSIVTFTPLRDGAGVSIVGRF